MIAHILVAATCMMSAHSHADSIARARMVDSWCNGPTSYGISADADGRRVYVTRDIDGTPKPYSSISLGANLQPCVLRHKGASKGLGFLTFARNGDAFGVTYIMGDRQAHATIVQVFQVADTLTVGDAIPSIAGEHYASCPSVSQDGQIMVFATDRKGGAGGTDLWFVERQIDGSFGQPQHCGESINSPFQETTPHLLSNDSLLFSSDGLGGQGGMDVYLSVYRNGKWQEPVPVESVNSPANDTDAYRLPNGSIVFMRSSSAFPDRTDVWVVDSLQ